MFNFLMKKMLRSKMKGMPEAEQDKIFALIEKNPQFFKQIGEEIQEKVKSGKDQNVAAMEVMQKHQVEIQRLLSE
ncbi:MAG: hypothetical protein COV70_00415 [Parcubacteria group bacterium CG11_big_fil_rev_8_21_14_0_20_39_22]|nr:MAG: hypothetical protein COV70_00415 [Parcubacteria group bacterium CG11_big_fil_rev_8_21_14_0_20_39_22]